MKQSVAAYIAKTLEQGRRETYLGRHRRFPQWIER